VGFTPKDEIIPGADICNNYNAILGQVFSLFCLLFKIAELYNAFLVKLQRRIMKLAK
jgi:hypothetical protein